MKKSKKKAFTLTELLIVVIVIGVLSAAVLPKFSKIIETLKTTEAEELMASVRTEQEKRCALDKRYLTQMSEMTDIVKNNETKNFTITLASRGIDAASKGKYSYTLKMLSYADGRICCDGTECSKLNKDYPTCDELRGKPDYQESPENCAGPSAVRGCAGDAKEWCGCNNNGERTRTCDTTTGTWSNWSECSIPECSSCEGENTRSCGCTGEGTQTRTCDTATGTWSDWGECSEDPCPPTHGSGGGSSGGGSSGSSSSGSSSSGGGGSINPPSPEEQKHLYCTATGDTAVSMANGSTGGGIQCPFSEDIKGQVVDKDCKKYTPGPCDSSGTACGTACGTDGGTTYGPSGKPCCECCGSLGDFLWGADCGAECESDCGAECESDCGADSESDDCDSSCCTYPHCGSYDNYNPQWSSDNPWNNTDPCAGAISTYRCGYDPID